MPYDVKLPDIGEGVAEGEIVRWFVKTGETVREDQPLVEVMTDKASVEIPSPRAGVIDAINAAEGEVVPVGTVIVSIRTADEAARDAAKPSSEAAPAKIAAPVASAPPASGTPRAPAGGRVQATPAVRQLAKQLGVALDSLAGSGPGGAITADDVKRASGSVAAAPTAESAATERPSPAGPEERIPLRGLRRKIADHMHHSLATAAHYTFVAECDMTTLLEHRDSVKPKAVKAGVRLTFLPYVMKALVESLRRYPLLNAVLDDARAEIVVKKYFHIGFAVHTDEGLTVPVVRDVDRRSLFELAVEIRRLADAARARRLERDELQGGTFTVTSTGSKGGVLATPILHHPKVAILGIHEVKKRPAVVDGQIVIRDLGNLSLSLDHRVVDGAVGADFLYDLISRLESRGDWVRAEDLE